MLLIINNVNDCDDENGNTSHGDDAIDARAREQATEELVQAFEDAFDEGNDEGGDEDEDQQENK